MSWSSSPIVMATHARLRALAAAFASRKNINGLPNPRAVLQAAARADADVFAQSVRDPST